ncbi:MAG: IMP dehydrogenase [Chlorobi bacterium]|nr:IMP dehydrogenase [Chlorobiota bacterium]
MKILDEALTFDDVLLVPAYSEVLPHEVSLKTKLTKNISLNIPILSAAMDTVTGERMAIAIALEGGIGFIHKNMSIEEQANIVKNVKSYKFEQKEYPNSCTDKNNNLRVGAAVGVSNDLMERVDNMTNAGVDIITLDSAHGHSIRIIEALKLIKNKYPNLDVIAGNIVTAKAAQDLADAGADAVKIGVGPGSICTTRIVAGVGVPQLTAILDIFKQLKDTEVGIIADGGIKYSGDLAKAIAAGAHTAMLGSMLAGTDEALGKLIERDGKKYKVYEGMGSMSAMQRGSKDRYFQQDKSAKKLVPEGIEAVTAYKGFVSEVILQLTGGLRAGMGYCGTKDINDLRYNSQFIKISKAGLVESHPHDVSLIKNSPNYSK